MSPRMVDLDDVPGLERATSDCDAAWRSETPTPN